MSHLFEFFKNTIISGAIYDAAKKTLSYSGEKLKDHIKDIFSDILLSEEMADKIAKLLESADSKDLSSKSYFNAFLDGLKENEEWMDILDHVSRSHSIQQSIHDIDNSNTTGNLISTGIISGNNNTIKIETSHYPDQDEISKKKQ